MKGAGPKIQNEDNHEFLCFFSYQADNTKRRNELRGNLIQNMLLDITLAESIGHGAPFFRGKYFEYHYSLTQGL